MQGKIIGEDLGGKDYKMSRGGQEKALVGSGGDEPTETSQDPYVVGRVRSYAQNDPCHGIVSRFVYFCFLCIENIDQQYRNKSWF